MLRINKDSDGYSIVADLIATFIGGCASVLIGGFCNSMISTSSGSSFQKNCMRIGKFGLETITLYSTATKMREEIDDTADMYNEFAGVVETYQEKKLKEASGTTEIDISKKGE